MNACTFTCGCIHGSFMNNGVQSSMLRVAIHASASHENDVTDVWVAYNV
jgi:hypothetical protein